MRLINSLRLLQVLPVITSAQRRPLAGLRVFLAPRRLLTLQRVALCHLTQPWRCDPGSRRSLCSKRWRRLNYQPCTSSSFPSSNITREARQSSPCPSVTNAPSRPAHLSLNNAPPCPRAACFSSVTVSATPVPNHIWYGQCIVGLLCMFTVVDTSSLFGIHSSRLFWLHSGFPLFPSSIPSHLHIIPNLTIVYLVFYLCSSATHLYGAPVCFAAGLILRACAAAACCLFTLRVVHALFDFARPAIDVCSVYFSHCITYSCT